MILQPIVENALLHGITPKHDVGLIRITAEQQGNSYFIYVSDNGYGFPDEVLKSLTERNFSKIETTTTKSGIGLLSTNKRIQYFFGSSYGLSIKHSDFTGSTVGLFLPVK
ncbi:sensor histidine kinase [Colibacter massiliensis]|uniref:sensor histidine kinase n=1 Tax=Colibacter massiliensis TaxID=1852379 RepID=UPI00266B580B|nr:ATP-binding protein [Colibacter massiliensis]